MATRNFLIKNTGELENEAESTGVAFQGVSSAVPSEPTVLAGGRAKINPTVQGVQTVKTPINQSSPTAVVAEFIKNGALSSPYFDKVRQNMNRRTILTTMPVKDQNGRGKSGLRALVEGLGTFFDPRFGLVKSWGELGARGAAVGGKAVGGLINPEWDENADRETEIAKIDQENERLIDIGQKDWQMQNQVATLGIKQQAEINKQANNQTNAELRARNLDLREARQNFQKLNAEQKTVLSTIMKRGFYKEGVNKDEDAAIDRLGIVLPDFDSRKPITKEQAGKFQQWDHDKETWIDAPGMPVDESEVPIEYSVGGVRMKLRPRDIAGIEAGKERQVTQQNFTREENDKNRAVQLKRLETQVQQFRASSAQEYVAKRAAIVKSQEAGDLSKTEAENLLKILDANNQNLK